MEKRFLMISALLLVSLIMGLAGISHTMDAIGGDGDNNASAGDISDASSVRLQYSEIDISATASESVKPDQATFAITITSIDKNSKTESARKNALIVKNVTDALISSGINESEISTSSYSIRERYKSIKDSWGDYQSVLEGYETVHTLTVRTEATGRLGEFFDISLKNGAGDVGDVRWSLKDQTKRELGERLSKKALADANRKIALIVPNAKDIALGKAVETVSYGYWDYSPGYTFGAAGYIYSDHESFTEVDSPLLDVQSTMAATYYVSDSVIS